jgi:hypothetical protein
MTISENVVAFLGGQPGALCDGCIRAWLTLQEVAIVTLTLSLWTGFQRRLRSCSSTRHLGGQEKLIIRAL